MDSKITSRNRMEALVNNERMDQLPVALWKHFPVDDQSPERLAAATIHFQNTFSFDFIKVSPSSSFCLKDWGARDVWNGDPEGTRDYLESVIKQPEDWEKLSDLDPEKGWLGNQLECLKIIRDTLGQQAPIIQTIFSPLSQAKNLAGKANILDHLRKYPEALKKGLQTITNTTLEFIHACQKTGIDGVFFAVQHASTDILTESEFLEFGKTFDSQLFPIIREFWFNVAHIHGNNIMPEQVKDYPMQVFNWHDRDTVPDLKTGKKVFNKVVCGGLGRIHPMELGSDDDIKSEIDDAVQQTNGEGFILGTGCVLKQTTPYGNIKAAVDHIRSINL